MNNIKLMKKFLLALATPFITASTVFAQESIQISAPKAGYANLGNFVTNVITIGFAVAILVVLVMLVWGAFEWITSGGDKDAVAKARNRIINALIGLAVLAIAFAMARVAAQFLGFDLANITVPTPNPSPSGL